MTRQTTTTRRYGRDAIGVVSPVQRKQLRVSKTQNRHDVRDKHRYSAYVQNQEEAGPKTVSAAWVFKSQARLSKRDKKHIRRKSRSPELDLVLEFKDGMEDARVAINDNLEASFNDVHAALNDKLEAFKTKDQDTMKTVSETVILLQAPLTDEKIETQIRRDGKRVTEIVEIGKQVAAFQKILEKEEQTLKDCWAQWDNVQNEYLELGVEVFGPKVFGKIAVELESDERGFKRELEMLNLEQNTRVDELDEEIENIGAEILQKMRRSEKELDALTKMEQTKLLQALMQD